MSEVPAGLLLAMAACGVLGLLVPELVRRVPEPAVADDAAPKETYAAIGDRPGLAGRAALASAVAGAVIGAAVGAQWPLLYLVPLVPIGVALAVIDWRTRLLPTRVIAPAYVLTVALVAVATAVTGDVDDLARAGWGWAISGGSFLLLWFVHPRGLGYGDVRLSGVLGIALGYLGWGELVVGMYAGFLLGGVGGGLLALLRVVERRAFPFGPFMLVGALVGVAVGDRVLRSLVGG
ncbi:A24 family peptidase [Nocardioides sp. cx-173]|uniref:prepilin peptidase n=1 Tax=Nocardioides sp. cx-173 TaxID=2898796 RepID=UPI001E3B7825|nr:A24 family peptidase [Nocardioides sp. cx-173]MCD4526065.1 A24 family peptidase [Nocardioides sp. cx-173]UGB43758.1 A24 family peptidase [Nocardioides sp. cx-173]